MCYYLVFSNILCINDHPQPSNGEIFQRQCRQQAEDSRRTGNWEVKCDRSTPPVFVFEKPDTYMTVTNNSDCETCCNIETDPELKKLQAASDEISVKRDKKKELRARLVKRLVDEVYPRPVRTDAERDEWKKDCDRWEKFQKDIEAEIKSLTNELEVAEKKWADKKREIEEPGEDDFIDAVLEKYERRRNRDERPVNLFYFGRPTHKEAMEHPHHFPKCFPP